MIEVKLNRAFVVTGAADLDAHTDSVMEHLIALEDDALTDSDVAVDFSKNVVDVAVIARAQTFDVALENADSAIRTAIHAAGGSTPDWKSPIEYTPTGFVATPVDEEALV